MSLTIQQIEALARRTLRGDFQGFFFDRAEVLYRMREANIRTSLRAAVGVSGHLYGNKTHREHREREKLIRIECRVALAALYARLYQEQQERDQINAEFEDALTVPAQHG